MTTAEQMRMIAEAIAARYPGCAADLFRLANIVARQERALDEIAADAAEDAAIAERAADSGSVVKFPVRLVR